MAKIYPVDVINQFLETLYHNFWKRLTGLISVSITLMLNWYNKRELELDVLQ